MSRRLGAFAAVVLCVVVACLVAGSEFWWSATAIDQKYWLGDPVPPCFVDAVLCGGHVLGTDEVGRDLAARLLLGAEDSLLPALLAAILTLVVGYGLGTLALRGGQAVAYIIQRAADGMTSLPRWPTLALVAIASAPLWRAFPVAAFGIAAALVLWPRIEELVVAGATPRGLLQRATKDWASAILLLATLDFFGLGPPPPQATWGGMLEFIQMTLSLGWWVAVFPAACIFMTVLALEIAARTVFAEERT